MFLIIFLLFVLWENTMNWIWIETENKKKNLHQLKQLGNK